MQRKRDGILYARLRETVERLERLNIEEYLRYLDSPRRIIWVNLISGLSRGLGMALGFTLLGAIAIYFLQMVAYKNLPVIGDFLASLYEIVQKKMG